MVDEVNGNAVEAPVGVPSIAHVPTPFLVIDSDDYLQHGILAYSFASGEPHVLLPREFRENLLLFLKLRTWQDVGHAALLMDALDNQGAFYVAFIPYFPGSRQDRTDGRTPVTKHVMMSLLRPDLRRIYTFDMHSKHEWMTDISHVTHIPASALRALAGERLGYYDGVIAPRARSVERAHMMAAVMPNAPVVIECDAEGRTPEGSVRLGLRYLVIDDICDDATHLNVVASLLPDRVECDLWVSHGVFAAGVGAVSARYGAVFTTDSWYHPLRRHFTVDQRTAVVALSQLFPIIMNNDPYIQSRGAQA